ncbi:MAG: NAD-dependent epimerase/dehydratase family protein [Rhodospirillaceae bacterium]
MTTPSKIVITGSSGRIGRALYWRGVRQFRTFGLDLTPSSSTTHIADIREQEVLLRLFEGADVVFHAAALHAPHVDVERDAQFRAINIDGTRTVFQAAQQVGVRTVVFSSTTALYGYACQDPDKAVWIDEQTTPAPRTIYHRTKLEAEAIVRSFASETLRAPIIRLSRCFPEPADQMAVSRLHRGVDYRDVAAAQFTAAQCTTSPSETFVVSGTTPFERSDCEALKTDAAAVIRARVPDLAQAFEQRGWALPRSIDRVYDASKAAGLLDWQMEFGHADVLKQFDCGDFEVLPPEAKITKGE